MLGAGFDGDLSGFVDGVRAFQAEGKGDVGIEDLPQAGATSYFGVVSPGPGRWTLTVEPGSAPVTQLRSANGIPAARVRAGVGRARRGARVLRWRFRARAGRQVSFWEFSPSGGRRILATARGRGSRAFTPLAGAGGRRRIVALVVDAGVPSERATVATFKASPATTPGRPGRVRLRRGRRGSATATWTPARGAARYLVAVRVSDGRRLLVPRERSTRRLTIADVGRRDTVTVRVRALSALGKTGPPLGAKL